MADSRMTEKNESWAMVEVDKVEMAVVSICRVFNWRTWIRWLPVDHKIKLFGATHSASV
jgi:hypothetical protein